LPLERRRDLPRDELAGARLPIAGNALLFGAADERVDEAAALMRVLGGDPKLV